MPDTHPSQRRISVNVNDAMVEVIDRYCAENQVSITEAVRRAFSLLEVYRREVIRDGGTVLIKTGDGQIKELIFSF